MIMIRTPWSWQVGMSDCRERDMPNPGGGAFLSSDAARGEGGELNGESETTFEHIILQGTRSCAGLGSGGDRVS